MYWFGAGASWFLQQSGYEVNPYLNASIMQYETHRTRVIKAFQDANVHIRHNFRTFEAYRTSTALTYSTHDIPNTVITEDENGKVYSHSKTNAYDLLGGVANTHLTVHSQFDLLYSLSLDGGDQRDFFFDLEKIWNSPLARQYVPDLLNINFNGSVVPGYGGGVNIAVNLITRGPDMGVHITSTPSKRYGFHGDYSVNGGIGYYIGSGENVNFNSLLGKGYDASADLGAVGVGLWASTRSNYAPSWVGASVGVGPGIGGSVGKSTTSPVWSFRFRK